MPWNNWILTSCVTRCIGILRANLYFVLFLELLFFLFGRWAVFWIKIRKISLGDINWQKSKQALSVRLNWYWLESLTLCLGWTIWRPSLRRWCPPRRWTSWWRRRCPGCHPWADVRCLSSLAWHPLMSDAKPSLLSHCLYLTQLRAALLRIYK